MTPDYKSTQRAALSVYYDGGCPLCRAEISGYQNAEGGNRIRWVDAHNCTPEELGPGLEPSAALARLHVRRADGSLIEAAAAFVAIWRTLPGWRWLAVAVDRPVIMPILERAYRVFLVLRPIWRPKTSAIHRLPRHILRELRTDHAGESGAVMIYRGILAVTRDTKLRAFAQHHLAVETQHLAAMNDLLPTRRRSWLLPLWRLSGWLTGTLPALVSPRATYATIEAVETFVDHHYGAQVGLLDAAIQSAMETNDPQQTLALMQQIRSSVIQFQTEEVMHRDDAHSHWDGQPSLLLRGWCAVVEHGSAIAVGICRYI